MNLLAVVTDNIAELLAQIIEFTHRRQQVLIENINNMHRAGYVPRDLPAGEFSGLIQEAIEEHTRSQRLLLRDTENIKFGGNGGFMARHVADEWAEKLLQEDRDEYLRLQIDKLLENSLNQRIATELLRHKQGAELSFELNLN